MFLSEAKNSNNFVSAKTGEEKVSQPSGRENFILFFQNVPLKPQQGCVPIR